MRGIDLTVDPGRPADGPSPAQFVLGVDLDGVCVDFYGHLRPIAEEWLGRTPGSLTSEITYDMPEWNLEPMGGYKQLQQFAVIQRRLFADAPPVDGAPAALRRLSREDDLRVRIITDRLQIEHFHQVAVAQTIEWLDHHGIPYKDLCLLKDKAAVGADLYIDDTPQNVRALRKRGLDTIVYTTSLNHDVEPPRANNWEELESMIRERLESWRRSAQKPQLAGR